MAGTDLCSFCTVMFAVPAAIACAGTGDLTDNQKQGWFSRHLGWLWPF